MAIGERDWARLQAVQAHASKTGRDLFEVLDQFEMLATEDMRRKGQVSTLEQLWHRLDNQRPADILHVYTGKGYGTPDDMYRALLDWLEAVIKATAEGALE
jgi:hypothetical protein